MTFLVQSSAQFQTTAPVWQDNNAAFQLDLPVLIELQHYLNNLIHFPLDAAFSAGKLPEKSGLYEGYQNLIINTLTPDKRHLRISVFDRKALSSLKTLYFVGFFGQKKKEIEPELNKQIRQLDKGLLKNLEEYPFILSYSSLELGDRYNYANLVLFSQPEGIKHWKRKNYLHRKAAKQVAPQYYENIRIHLGSLNSGLNSTFSVATTHFYEFS